MQKKARIIAFYLPQYHPIPENNQWWGEGFTEWTNVTKAKPLYKGHYQPNLPADLGFYDLRLSEAREAQAALAKEHGIEAFAYWHYWFGNGKRLLERPFNEVIKSGKPDFPFCLAWANQSWTGIWHGAANKTLIQQTYNGIKDYQDHFYHLLEAFNDKRYLRIKNKPVFLIYSPQDIPDLRLFADTWQELAVKENLNGFYFISITVNPKKFALDAFVQHAPILHKNLKISWLQNQKKRWLNLPEIHPYKNYVEAAQQQPLLPNEYPLVLPNWDNTPRSGSQGLVYSNATPQLFGEHLRNAIAKIQNRKDEDQKIIFLKSWNEWAEGNYVEPDTKFGKQWLETIKQIIY